MVCLDPSALRETRWREYAVRFLFGGLMTVAAGIIAKTFGPAVGGLFLAFPVLFPASATLVEKHAIEREQRTGTKDAQFGRNAASLDAEGAARGSIALILFAILVWLLIPAHRAGFVLAGSALAWFALAICIWRISAHGKQTQPLSK